MVEAAAAAGAETAEDRVRAWRRAHPAADLDAILDAVEAEVGALRQRCLAAALGEGPAAAPSEPACPRCGGRLEHHGRRRREVLIPHQAAPVRLERDYLVCSSCGASLSPPR